MVSKQEGLSNQKFRNQNFFRMPPRGSYIKVKDMSASEKKKHRAKQVREAQKKWRAQEKNGSPLRELEDEEHGKEMMREFASVLVSSLLGMSSQV